MAARAFSAQGQFKSASYLLERGLQYEPLSIEYIYEYFSLKSTTISKKLFNNFVSKHVFKLGKSNINEISEEDCDKLTEVLVTYMRLNNYLAKDLHEKMRLILDRSSLKDLIQWNESIIYARKRNYSKAYESLKNVTIIGDGDELFKSFLQVKTGIAPRFCLQLVSNVGDLRKKLFVESCNILISNPKEVDSKILETGEVLPDTALYEALNK